MSSSNSLLDAVVEIALLLFTRLFFTAPADDQADQAAVNTTPVPPAYDPDSYPSRVDETGEQFLSEVVNMANSRHNKH
jgi:hypothetical protein